MHVSEISKALNVSPDTVRYYTRLGLVTPKKDINGYKIYSESDLHRFQFALRAKKLGFKLSDVRQLIDISDKGEAPCPLAREIISENLDRLKTSIEESLELFRRMEKAVNDWKALPDCTPDGNTICSLIEHDSND